MAPLLDPPPPAAYHSGVDLIEIERVRDVLDRHGDRFRQRCYTAREIDYCGRRLAEYAVRFAAKEAVMKALGTGARGLGWKEIEILANARGKPVVILHGRALARANTLGIREVEISLTHSTALACAFVIAGPGLSPGHGA